MQANADKRHRQRADARFQRGFLHLFASRKDVESVESGGKTAIKMTDNVNENTTYTILSKLEVCYDT